MTSSRHVGIQPEVLFTGSFLGCATDIPGTLDRYGYTVLEAHGLVLLLRGESRVVKTDARPDVHRRPLLLLVDDEPGVRGVIERFADRAGFDALAFSSGHAAIEQLRRHPADLAFIDLRMPDVDGLHVLRQFREIAPLCEVALMTGFATIDSAVEAIKLGAIDYLCKPIDFDRIEELLLGVHKQVERRQRLLKMESDLARRFEFYGMIGRSAVMQETFNLIRRFAPHVRNALITGETGTGKELAARALHKLGQRRERRLVAVNCSAVVETLFETEFFGHVRGAFTGAAENKAGMFETADGGTLFLDEVGELPLGVQGKLLRVLELGEVQRVGSLGPRQVDVAVFAATNRDLRAEVSAGRFRSDLFYRLDVVELHLSPLRERREDIPYLTAAFVRDAAARLRKRVIGMTPTAERVLLDRRWDGNVRELRNVIERACILCEGQLITERELPLAGHTAESATPPSPVPPEDVPIEAASTRGLATVEREQIVKVLETTAGNKKAAAKLLGLSRRALYRRLEQHGLGESIQRRGPGPSHGPPD